MSFLAEYGMFLLKALTVLVAVVLVIRAVARAVGREQEPAGGQLRVRPLNRVYQRLGDRLRSRTLSKQAYKQVQKERQAARKTREAAREKPAASTPGAPGAPETEAPRAPSAVYVLTFEGDLRASAVESLRQEISAIVAAAVPGDEVLLRLESSGGLVHAYGLAASQLDRLRSRGIKLTVAVDGIAASGGYMMACVADRILAAPFSVIGSIGVVATVPNFHRLLEKHDVDIEQITAGEYKRTLSLLGENTEQGRAKFTQQIEETHVLFKAFILKYRPDLELDKVATGEHWYGTQALALGLVDALSTSDDYLLQECERADLYEVTYVERKSLGGRLSAFVAATLRRVMDSGLQASRESRYV